MSISLRATQAAVESIRQEGREEILLALEGILYASASNEEALDRVIRLAATGETEGRVAMERR